MEVKKLKKILSSFPFFLLMLSILFFLTTQTNKILKISGTSMVPTLNHHDICFMESFVTPEREQIYVILEPDDHIWAIKRLIGVPGDRVELKDGNTYVNDSQILPEIEGTWENMVFELGPDEYLFIGDNRQDSYDGRYWSRPIKREEILYHVTFRFWPLHRMCGLE